MMCHGILKRAQMAIRMLRRLLCRHPEIQFHSATVAEPAGRRNVRIGLVARCTRCRRAWTGDLTAGLAQSIDARRRHPEMELVNAEDLQPGDLIWHGGGWAVVGTQWYADRDGHRVIVRTNRGEVHAAAESPVEVLIQDGVDE